MAAFNVLLVGSRQRLPEDLPRTIEHDSGNEVLAEATSRVDQAVARVTEKGFDAVVCWVEREDELAGVIRIRKTRADVPIVVLSPSLDPTFENLARQAGATRIATDARNPAALSALIRLAVQSGELLCELREQTQGVKSLSRDLGILSKETRRLAGQALVSARRSETFVPLLVEDDPDQAQLMVRAFQETAVVSWLPILRSGEEAIAYLSAAPPFDTRSDSQEPTIVLLDVELPGKSGLEVLEWIRLRPKLRRLPVVMLSSSSSPDHIRRAYELGANSYLLKPAGFEALVDLVTHVKQYWGATIRE